MADPRFARPTCIARCIGTQKAGTTFLNRHFGEHPRIHMSTVREFS